MVDSLQFLAFNNKN